MKICLCENVTLKTIDGQRFRHKAGDRLSVSDNIGEKLISQGKTKQFFGPPVRYESKLLNETIWLINDPSQLEECQGEEVAYTPVEFHFLSSMQKKARMKIHEAKRLFPGSVILKHWLGTGKDRFEAYSEKGGGDKEMKKFEAFKSRYLTKAELDKPKIWTISEVEMEEIEFKDGTEEKCVIHFEEQESKPLVLNSGNWDIIEELYGEDSNMWIGKRIEIHRDNNVKFGKQKIGGIRVGKPSPTLFSTVEQELSM